MPSPPLLSTLIAYQICRFKDFKSNLDPKILIRYSDIEQLPLLLLTTGAVGEVCRNWQGVGVGLWHPNRCHNRHRGSSSSGSMTRSSFHNFPSLFRLPKPLLQIAGWCIWCAILLSYTLYANRALRPAQSDHWSYIYIWHYFELSASRLFVLVI